MEITKREYFPEKLRSKEQRHAEGSEGQLFPIGNSQQTAGLCGGQREQSTPGGGITLHHLTQQHRLVQRKVYFLCKVTGMGIPAECWEQGNKV